MSTSGAIHPPSAPRPKGPDTSPYDTSQMYSRYGGVHSHESLKILPIVVIPPIAPISPIHISHGHDYGISRSARYGRPLHRYQTATDQKSFADYGESGGLRENHRSSRGSALRYSSMKSIRPLSSYSQTSKLKSNLQDEILDDYELGPMSWANSRSLSEFRRPSPGHKARLAGGRSSRISSIQDILDQPIFDDEPNSGIDEFRGASHINRVECCQPPSSHGHRLSGHQYLDNGLENSVLNPNAIDLNAMEKYQSHEGRKSRLSGFEELDPESKALEPLHHSVYSSSLVGKDSHLPEESPLHEDESWRYESIKSVAIASLNDTVIQANSTGSPLG